MKLGDFIFYCSKSRDHCASFEPYSMLLRQVKVNKKLKLKWLEYVFNAKKCVFPIFFCSARKFQNCLEKRIFNIFVRGRNLKCTPIFSARGKNFACIFSLACSKSDLRYRNSRVWFFARKWKNAREIFSACRIYWRALQISTAYKNIKNSLL